MWLTVCQQVLLPLGRHLRALAKRTSQHVLTGLGVPMDALHFIEAWLINFYFSMKPPWDRLVLEIRRMKGSGPRAIAGVLALRLWFLFRGFVDYLIDLFFCTFICDEKKQYKPPKIKDAFLFDSAVTIAEKIRRKELSAEAVVQAFIHRINSSNTITSSMVDNRFIEALKEAKDIDQMLKGDYDEEQLKQSKPYLGVPFTAKESIQCKGLSFTLGLYSRLGVKGEEDASVVQHMKAAGGILLGVTNIPELNLWCETANMVYKRTLNPYNLTRTVGGSSGGEAATLAVCGSPLGIGTDIGGSIRMPAFYCGVFGHKPTTGICSLKGTTRRDGTEVTMCVSGPMTRKSEDLIPFLKVLAADKAPLLKLDNPVDMKSLRVVFMEESGDVRSSPVSTEMKVAVRKAVNHLQEATGKPAARIALEGIQYSYRLWRHWMTKEPHQFAEEIGNREKEVSLLVELPKKLFNASEHTLAALLKLMDVRILPQEKAAWAEDVTARLKKQILEVLGEDGVLIFPSHPTTAKYHNSSYLRPFNFGYWAIFNVLHLPVTQVPLGLSEEGLPVGVQVVAAPYKDRLCLAVAKELEQAFGGWVPPFPT